MISTWDIPKHDFWGKKIRFLKMHTSTIIDNVFNWNKSRRQNPEIV